MTPAAHVIDDELQFSAVKVTEAITAKHSTINYEHSRNFVQTDLAQANKTEVVFNPEVDDVSYTRSKSPFSRISQDEVRIEEKTPNVNDEECKFWSTSVIKACQDKTIETDLTPYTYTENQLT